MAAPGKTAKVQAFQMANNLAEVSTLLLAMRIHSRKSLSEAEKKEILELEDCLNELVAKFQAKAIDLIAEEARAAAAEADIAIDLGRDKLEEIDDIKKAIKIGAAVVSVASALLSRSFGAVAKAAGELHALSKEGGLVAPGT